MRRPLSTVLLLAGCALGYRGEAELLGEHDLRDTTELRVELPDTPLSVEACAADLPETCPATLSYDGVWLSVAGSRADAREQAAAPVLRFERSEGFAILRAEVPLSVQGLVDLEMGELRLPDDRHLDLRTGVGDVSVRGTEASVVVDVEVGDVLIRGADAGLAVRTGQGDIDVRTPGHAELRTSSGNVEVVQTGDARDLLVHTEQGTIVVTLASDADVDLQIDTRGRITVRTPAITTITSGHFERVNGSGSARVRLVSPRGDIEVRSVDPG
ncbi:MAG: DUF4097 family beta strand repeat protein [Myxococcales bacterium]|nr:DUF4097 family beta strand repeat protein [Myxococcales bacterium]MCB9713617.1 DUF4097 family beta strand repeat protein [Myxococcales bacterium]